MEGGEGREKAAGRTRGGGNTWTQKAREENSGRGSVSGSYSSSRPPPIPEILLLLLQQSCQGWLKDGCEEWALEVRSSPPRPLSWKSGTKGSHRYKHPYTQHPYTQGSQELGPLCW